MSQDVLIRAIGLSRRFAGHQAVSDLDLELRRGEVLGLLGPNGAGKTTTLRMLCGTLAPSAGSVEIAGHAMDRQPRQAKAQLGALPDTPPLHPELTVDEFLHFCAALHGLPRGNRAEAVARARRDCALDGVARQVIGTLSKGYQQRVGLAQAIIHAPAVIVLDEPTVGLDPNQMRQIRALIRELANRHAIILSSHILSEVQAVCDRVAIMAGGRIVHDAPLAALDAGASHHLLLGLRHPPQPDVLQAIPGVEAVESLPDQRLRIWPCAGQDPRDALVRSAAEQGWGLYELQEEHTSLEQLFTELTA